MDITISIPSERIADLLSTAIECGDPVTQGWCGGVKLKSYTANRFPIDTKGTWYETPELFEDKNLELIVTEFTDESVEDGAPKDHSIGLDQINRGFVLMAEKYGRHLADILTENSDAATADIFLQLVVLGEERYA